MVQQQRRNRQYIKQVQVRALLFISMRKEKWFPSPPPFSLRLAAVGATHSFPPPPAVTSPG